MKISGIICEFNPLHNGHCLIINEAKKNSDFVVCLMSGNFSQRGLPCCMNKHTRASLAIAAGADIVLELPVAFATNGADEFAFGAIKILDALGVHEIVFGSECGNLDTLQSLASFRQNEPEKFKQKLQTNLKSGMSFSSAYASAMSDITSEITLQKAATSPNDILASSYILAAKKQNSNISFRCIERTDNGYNSTSPNGAFLSASAIIENKTQGNDISAFVPAFTLESWNSSPSFNHDILTALLRHEISKKSSHDLSQILDMNEGLENVVKKAFVSADNLFSIISTISSKRYRKPRIQKLLLHTLLGLTAHDYDKIKNTKPAVKVLAVNKNKKQLLSTMCKSTKLDLICKNADYDKLSQDQQLSALLDQKASDIYAICTGMPLNQDKTFGTLYI